MREGSGGPRRARGGGEAGRGQPRGLIAVLRVFNKALKQCFLCA